MNAARAVFVGRERETEELLAGLVEAVEGDGKLFIVEGEPGIGKSRLAEWLASRASQTGVRVLWTRGWGAGGAPSYWLWIQAIRDYLRAHGGGALSSMPAGTEADLAQIVPEILGHLPSARRRAANAAADTEQARFRLFEAVTNFFRSASEDAPLLIVLDDLATADRPSLLILHYLARELSSARIMAVATCRDAEVRALPALSEIMTELVREGRYLRLEGLSESETAELLRARTGHEPDTRALHSVYRATAGNPFFIEAVATVLPPEAFGGLDKRAHERLRLPGGLAAAVRGHLAMVPAPVADVLRIAAAIGLEFDVDVLASVAGLDTDLTFDALTEAERVSLVGESDEVPGRYQFRHALVRETLYGDIPAARRIGLHTRIAEVLEEKFRANPGPHLSEIAFHFYEGARAGGADRAFSYAERAAEMAESVSAFEEAARCHQMALSAAKLHARLGDAERCRLMLKLGDALNRSGDYAGAADTFREAAKLAERLGDADLQVRAALGYPGLQWTGPASTNQEPIELLERALRALGSADSANRAIVMARLAAELYHRPAARARRELLASGAIETARRLGDKSALLAVLSFHDWVLSGPDMIDRRIHNADELSEVAEELGSYQGMYLGFLSRLICFRQRGDAQRAEAEAEAMALVARMTHLPVCDWAVTSYEAARELVVGAFAEGEQTARRCITFAERMQGREAWDLFWPAMIVPFAEQGRLDEIAPMASAAVARHSFPAHRALLAWIHALRGEKAAAESELASMAAGLFRLPHDNGFLVTLAAFAQVSAAVGDARRAAELYELLQPYAGLNVMFGPLAQFGSAARYLAVLAATCGRIAEAREWFERAIHFNRKIEARPALAWTQTEYAAVLRRTGASADLKKAVSHLESALETARTLGMRRLEETITRIHDEIRPESAKLEPPPRRQTSEIGHRATSPVARMALGANGSTAAESGEAAAAGDSAGVPAHQAIFRNDGDYWTIVYRGSVVRLRHGKGLTCLAYLLSHPESEIHAASLAAVMADKAARLDAARAHEAGAAAADLGDAGPMLDAQAKVEYRGRVQELRAEAEEARLRGDAAAASRIEAEMDFIAAELGRAVGIGGRDRRAASAAERARLNVTKAIKSVIAKIAERNRLLGQHLTATVKTGTFCSYTPDPAARISWKI
jgi:tetratricopeptide (TPR) repeat protein